MNPKIETPKKEYPIIDDHRKHYVRVPVLITKKNRKHPLHKLEIGKFVAVDVLECGYEHLISPLQFSTKEECQKGCDIHNSYHGWSEQEVNEIIKKSYTCC